MGNSVGNASGNAARNPDGVTGISGTISSARDGTGDRALLHHHISQSFDLSPTTVSLHYRIGQ